jgi:hypothetical protein
MQPNEDFEVVGQAVSRRQLGPMARGITARIGDGTPVSMAGFTLSRRSSARPGTIDDPDPFRSRELAYLLFLRWLTRSGRLAP